MGGVNVPPAARRGNACSGGCGTTDDAKYNYLRGYFNAHMLSMPSHRYTYITWIVIALIVIIIAAMHHLGFNDGSYIGAVWSRWAIRNRVVKIGSKSNSNGSPKRRKSITFPSFGRAILLVALIVVPVVLTLVGADYIRPTANVFDMKESWPSSHISPYTVGLNRRLEWGLGNYPRVLTNPPTITLPYRTWWTAGGRTGAMTNGLTPLIVVIALKQVPFALLSTKLLGGFAFDRLSLMHKWGGRVVWLYATAHIALWSVQLARDHAFNVSIWYFVFMWQRFRWGWVSYGFFTLMVLLSIGPIRSNYYEFFYVAHVVCVIGFMISAWLHHPPLGAWMYVTLLWWLAERITRTIKVAYINGIGFKGRQAQVVVEQKPAHIPKASVGAWHLQQHAPHPSFSAASSQTLHSDMYSQTKTLSSPPLQPLAANQTSLNPHGTADRRKTRTSAMYDPVSDVIGEYTTSLDNKDGSIPMRPLSSQRGISLRDDGPVGQSDSVNGFDNPLRPDSPQSSSYHTSADQYANRSAAAPERSLTIHRPAMAADVAAVLRPGFAYVQLLPGKTLRLTLRTPNAFTWLPGQYVNLSIPQLRWWQSHPFTVASAYNAEFPSSTIFNNQRTDDIEKGLITKSDTASGRCEGRTIVLLLRARAGFTQRFWDYVRVERERQIRKIEETTGVQYSHGEVAKTATGVHIRAIVDGPFGSSQRTRWSIHSTVVIVCGGSGISYGMSVLEHLCAVMAGVKQERKSNTRRVRFVWILREYSHLQWVASSLRRCVEMVPPEMLQVDLYVTSARARQRAAMRPARHFSSQEMLNSTSYDASIFGATTYDDAQSLHNARFTEDNNDDDDEYNVDAYDLTQFDGEDASAPTAAEARISERVHKEGKLRRAHTRRATIKRNKQRGGKNDGNPAAGRQGGVASREHLTNSIFSEDAVMRAAQNHIHQGGGDQLRQPQAQRAVGGLTGRDTGDLAAPSAENQMWMDSDDEETQRLNVRLHAGSSAPSPAFGAQDEGYFAHSNHFQHAGASPLPISPNMTGSPAFMPGPGSMGRRTPEPYAGSIHTLQPSMANSTTHLNASFGGPQSRPSPLANPPVGAYQGGDMLEATQSMTDVPIDLDEAENADMSVMAELARVGHPKLDKIVREEVEQSTGKVMVAACGPNSLGSLIRRVVTKQIDLKAVRAGRPNAFINVATESYEWGG